ncbi:RDD family protein [Methyloradius palustris]|uniref:RDD family protein n=1 Tax=Methyloradius palustris TaxID=2778876 RepID=UPI001C8BAB67|nr:RDD family protein [Methyloradius palustris]
MKLKSSPGWLRVIASMFYDSLLLLAIFFTVTFPFILIFGNATQAPQRYYFQVYLWLIAGAYFIWCWYRGGQSPAMKVWRIKVVNQQGSPINLAQSVRRYVLASFGLILCGAGFLWAFFDREGLFMHDRLTGSRLILIEKPASK